MTALASNGSTKSARGRAFKFVPPARTVTLQIRDPKGIYFGPLVATGKGRSAVLGIRAGARLGKIRLYEGYARPVRRPRSRWLDEGITARARAGVPIGVGLRGRVRSAPSGPPGVGRDQDRDGIPGAFDIDDNGNLALDVNEPRAQARVGHGGGGSGVSSLPVTACPPLLCSGRLDVGVTSLHDVDTPLAISIAAAVLATASLLLQLMTLVRRRRRHVHVDLRLGLPIYQQGGGDWAVFVEVANETEQPVRWVSAELELSDGRRLYLMQYPPGGELPAVLQPHESHQTWTKCRDLEQFGLDLSESIVAIAKLDTGDVVRSPERRLLSRSLAERLHLSRH